MKLYLISQSVNNDYDTYDSAVVAASNEDEARNMSPSSGCPVIWIDEEEYYSVWCYKPEQVKVEYLGESIDNFKGVVCASFNAG